MITFARDSNILSLHYLNQEIVFFLQTLCYNGSLMVLFGHITTMLGVRRHLEIFYSLSLAIKRKREKKELKRASATRETDTKYK